MSEIFRDSAWDRHGMIRQILEDTPVPRFVTVRQKFDPTRIEDIPGAMREQLAQREIAGAIRNGARIAVAVGSRGIANLEVLVRSVVGEIEAIGGLPFVVPAMGSHGGATAEGQKAVLAAMGVTEERVGAAVLAGMETVVVGHNEDGKPVFMDKIASEADGVVLLGRVKPHTAFRGVYESGLCKMMAIGLANQSGAQAVHAEGFGRMAHNVPAYARTVLAGGKILFGVAVVENAFDETRRIVAISADQIMDREPTLLEEARALMPQIKFNPIDVLICDQIGKNFSGDGMDPNITASYVTPYATGGPTVQRYVVLDLSEETHGNAIGAGVAHCTTKRLFDKTDFDATYPNALTSRVLSGARMAMVFASDSLAIRAAIYTCVDIDRDRPRIVRIPNTSHVGEIMVSEGLLEEARAGNDVEILGSPQPLPFDEAGNLL